MLADRLAYYLNAVTLYGAYRPLGCEIIIASYDN